MPVEMRLTSANQPRKLYLFGLGSAGIIGLTYYTLVWGGDTADGLWEQYQPANPVDAPTALATAPTSSPPSTETSTTNVNLDLPPEYLTQSKDEEICDHFYTGSYLKYIATHQRPYCEDKSLGSVQCFTAQRLPAPWTSDWTSDPLCVAQGVLFSPAPDGVDFAVQCRQRDFAEEAQVAKSSAAAAELRQVPQLKDLGTYWFDTGAGASLRKWQFVDTADKGGCTAANSNNEWFVVARREHNTNIWHKMMEIWQARHTVDALRMAVNPATGEPWLSANEAATVRVVFEDDRQEPMDDLWTIATGNKPMRMSALAPGACLGNVILPLAGSSSPFWSALLESNHHENCRKETLMTAFISRVFDHFDITPRSVADINEHPTITINKRTTNRKFINLDRWVATLKERYPKSTINVVDFAETSFEDQLRLIQTTDVYVGHHGAGMTHLMFLPPDAAGVEIMPPFFPMRGFRSIARMRGVTHFSGRCMWKEEWDLAENGVAVPEGWTPPQSDEGWQSREWTYMLDDDFVGLVDAAVRNQQNRKFDGEKRTS